MIGWEAAGALGEIMGAIAVEGALIFEGMQFRQASNQTLQMLWQHNDGPRLALLRTVALES